MPALPSSFFLLSSVHCCSLLFTLVHLWGSACVSSRARAGTAGMRPSCDSSATASARELSEPKRRGKDRDPGERSIGAVPGVHFEHSRSSAGCWPSGCEPKVSLPFPEGVSTTAPMSAHTRSLPLATKKCARTLREHESACLGAPADKRLQLGSTATTTAATSEPMTSTRSAGAWLYLQENPHALQPTALDRPCDGKTAC